jgi:glycosyltransferase involved in cell wall biosynthesis
MIVFGHPTGNPNSHHAALAHYEAERLEAFCVPWFPGRLALDLLGKVPGAKAEVARLRRRRFEPLAGAPKIQGRVGEWSRLLRRKFGLGDQKMMYEANDWLMRTMAGVARRPSVTAVHSYEDCSLGQFEEAKRLGKQCIYDMPIGYYPWWEEKQKQLARDYAEWVPADGLPSSRYVRPEQKMKEMELADLVLVACSFVEKTIREFWPEKNIALAPYGVDAEFWAPAEGGDQETKRPRDQKTKRHEDTLRFIYAGGCSIRKGIPVLLRAWEKAQLREAELLLVGSWQLADSRLKQLPRGVKFLGPVGPERLRELYRESDVFVFPSFFEGFGLVILEAMACGLPVVASECSAGPDVLDESCGRVVAAGQADQLVETLRWFATNHEKLPAMKRSARMCAEKFTWENYRKAVSNAVGRVVWRAV